jgi:hypothetical protein
MKRVSLALLVLTGCGTTNFQPLVAHRVWQQDAVDKVFDAAVRVLHTADYMIAASDKKSGLISTDWKKYAVGDWKLQTRLNLLVLQESQGHVALSYKSKVQVSHPKKTRNEWVEVNAGEPIDADGYQKLTRELDEFFLEVQRYAGPSIQQR